MRVDLSSQLIHLTKGTYAEAEAAFRSIMRERRLRGSDIDVRGGDLVVCFSEAPIEILAKLFQPGQSSFRYAAFGVMVPKQWLFAQGGRPVIYQPETEYALLCKELQYRHVRFDEPGGPKDHTFEREWRIRTESLALDPKVCTLVVPDRDWDYRLRAEHAEGDMRLARGAPRAYRTPFARATDFRWHVLALGDLGANLSIDDS